MVRELEGLWPYFTGHQFSVVDEVYWENNTADVYNTEIFVGGLGDDEFGVFSEVAEVWRAVHPR